MADHSYSATYLGLKATNSSQEPRITTAKAIELSQESGQCRPPSAPLQLQVADELGKEAVVQLFPGLGAGALLRN
jgi:hypothetical protein